MRAAQIHHPHTSNIQLTNKNLQFKDSTNTTKFSCCYINKKVNKFLNLTVQGFPKIKPYLYSVNLHFLS